ncbi:MAG: hypothetical protein VB084_00515 [Syntrophomonadaceae bacterium]|nr:hypothetical protein [Syntrophomonadaceae bacterium]
MKKVYNSLFALHVFVGLGALFGGAIGIINPQSPLGMPVEVLRYSPFSNYLMPAIILFVVIGLGNILSAYMFRFKSRFQGYISGIFGCALVIFIVVQCIMMRAVAFLHVLYFMIGLIQTALSILILIGQQHRD